jgi:flavodoxin
MKILIVYFSLDGNSALVASELGKRLGADLLELKPADEKKRRGLAKYVWGGGQALFGKKPALKPYSVNPDNYDLIILGGPVWAGSHSPAVLAFLAETKPGGKKIGIFCCHGGGRGRAQKKLRALLEGNTIVGEADFRNPLRSERKSLESKIADWAARINCGA